MAKFSEYDNDELSMLEEEHEKRGFFAFFDILFNKFLKFMNINFLYILFGLPYMLFLFYFSPIYYPGELLLDAILRAFFALTVFLLWGCGPVSTGVAYVLRNYARREHAWIWADYIAAIKDNFKQGVAMLIMDIVAIYLLRTVVNFYILYGVKLFGMGMYVVLMCLIAIFTLLYTFMHFYIYQFIVTYEDKLKQHLKNAMLFAMIKWLPNLLIFVGITAITFLLFWVFQLFALVPYVIVLTIVLVFVIHFYSSRTIARTLNKQ